MKLFWDAFKSVYEVAGVNIAPVSGRWKDWFLNNKPCWKEHMKVQHAILDVGAKAILSKRKDISGKYDSILTQKQFIP